MDLYGLSERAAASDLYKRYTQYRESVSSMPVAEPMKEAFLALLNRAYDEALTESAEVIERAMSPRAARFTED